MNGPIWLKSRKFKPGQIQGELAEFDIAYSSADVRGVGEILVRGNGVEKMAIELVVEHRNEGSDNHYYLTDSLVDALEIHPDQSVARFRLKGKFDGRPKANPADQ